GEDGQQWVADVRRRYQQDRCSAKAQQSCRLPGPRQTASRANEPRRCQTAENGPKAAAKQGNPGERRQGCPSRRLGTEELPQQILQPKNQSVLVEVQPARVFQISWQPGDIKKPSIRQAEVLPPEQPHCPG